MTSPAVSVVIPTHNRAALLERAIRSVMNQTCRDWEIVLIDDGSSDDTEDVANAFSAELNGRFVYRTQKNLGASAARNAGIDTSRGRFVAFLDSDDEFAPNKLERQLELFRLRPELGLVYSDYAYIDLDGARHESAFDDKLPLARTVQHEAVAPRLCVCSEGLFDSLIRGYFIATIVGMVRRDALATTVRFPDGYGYAEEWLFYLRLARRCRAGFVDEPLSVHHFVPGSSARQDPHRNLLRYRALLAAISREFPDLCDQNRRVLNAHRARTAEQLAYDALRAGRHARAMTHLAEAFRFRPEWRSLGRLARAAATTIVPPLNRRSRVRDAIPQPAGPVVR
jgi:glycosyltransferase involved in cell wall biosynthesis